MQFVHHIANSWRRNVVCFLL
uniref:Uncharacterized protein n=1 Tax=Arundo donax TaxID=35708 RepID=A0A0A9HSW5_ARUDO